MVTGQDEQATRAAYDLVAANYAVLLKDLHADDPYDQAALGVFAAEVLADGRGRVGDLGCGPGRLTGHLRDLGLDPIGLDLSPMMIEVAKRTHPGLPFLVGSLTGLPLETGSLDGAMAWYSVIHTPPAEQPRIYDELARVVRPGGHLLVAFQVGDEVRRLTEAYGHALSLDAYRLSPDMVATQISDAGFVIAATLSREPRGQEQQSQCILMARRGVA